jgi:hypothetical protein
MKKFAMSAVVLVAGLLTTVGQGAVGGRRAEQSTPAKTETYVVVQVGDELRVIPKSQLKDLQKSTADEDKQNSKKYDDDKKAAMKKKEKFDQPKPVKRSVKTLKSGLKTEQDAEAFKEKHLQEKETSKTGKKTAA